MTPIYHITHLRNLPGILELGGLYANSATARRGVEHVNIAHKSIQDRRATTRVPLPPGGVLHDYVPFYFAPRSPMLYAIHRGNVQGYTEGQTFIVHLVTTAEAIAASGQPFVFTDGHAIMAFTDFYNDLGQLDQVDWDVMRARSWRDTLEDNDRLRRRNAEFLVHQHVPWALVQEIGVMDREIAVTLQHMLKDQAHPSSVTIHKEWYY